MIVKQHGGVLPWAAMPLTAGNDRKKAAALISQNRTSEYKLSVKMGLPSSRFFSFLPLGRCFFFRYMIRGIFEDSIKI